MKSFPFGPSNMFPQLQPDQVLKPNLTLSFVVFVKASWSGPMCWMYRALQTNTGTLRSCDCLNELNDKRQRSENN